MSNKREPLIYVGISVHYRPETPTADAPLMATLNRLSSDLQALGCQVEITERDAAHLPPNYRAIRVSASQPRTPWGRRPA